MQMMADETVKLSARTWTRAVDAINKEGYSDGVVDGQSAAFQSSFDVGYQQGFQFGFNLGLQTGKINNAQHSFTNSLMDARRINCQICLNNDATTENVVNLLNRQCEKNNEYFKVL